MSVFGLRRPLRAYRDESTLTASVRLLTIEHPDQIPGEPGTIDDPGSDPSALRVHNGARKAAAVKAVSGRP